MRERWIGLVAGLVLNALGNALSVSGNMGSAVWTASAVNIGQWLGLPIGILLFINGFVNAVTNQFLIRCIDWKRFVGEMVFICFFSYLVNFFVTIFAACGIGYLPILLKVVLSCLGIVIFCVGISLYQRADLLMHPNDDTTNILRFLYFHGGATISQFVDFIPPILAIAVSFFFTRRIEAVNIATIFSILCNGIIISTADRFVWPHLTHNFRKKKQTVNIINAGIHQ